MGVGIKGEVVAPVGVGPCLWNHLDFRKQVFGQSHSLLMAVKLRILTDTKEFSLTEEPASTINYVGFSEIIL